MRKQIFGRQLKRDKNERKALFKGLLSSLVLYGSIKTTEQKAKSIKGEADKLITKVKKQGENAKRSLAIHLTEEAIKKLIKDIAPLFSNRNGGYTRIVRLGRRVTDSASMVVIEWVEQGRDQSLKIKDQKLDTVEPEKKEVKKGETPKAPRKRAVKEKKENKK